MKAIVKTAALVAAAMLGTAGAAWAVPKVSDVSMMQIPGTRLVQINYTLADAAAIITLAIETNGVALPDSAVTRLTGDVRKEVQTGSCSIMWNAGADWPENVTESAKAQVTAWGIDTPPLYCVVDLSNGSGDYPVSYYLSAEALPHGGLTNNLYRTLWLAMRRIRTGASYPEHGAFTMGSLNGEVRRDADREDAHVVTLTKDFYMGVFEVTQCQWQQVMNNRPSQFSHVDYWKSRPVEKVTYDNIRGSNAGHGWPDNDGVDGDSFMGLLRTRADLTGFDLPTEAQWEYACRAGTDRALNVPLPSGSNLTYGGDDHLDTQMDLAGRYKFNGGENSSANSEPEKGTALVGSFPPNAWGLYDMHGNVWEWCLDRYVGLLGKIPVTDPRGVDSVTDRVLRGGSWSMSARWCRAASRDYCPVASPYNDIGFRLVRNIAQ